MWEKLKRFKKFEEKGVIESAIGPAKFQVGNKPQYYYGGGYFLGFATRKFRIENLERVEYGDDGLFLISVYHFSDRDFMLKYMKIDSLDDSDITAFDGDIIEGCVDYSLSRAEVRKVYQEKGMCDYYRESETRTLVDGKFVFQNQVIYWDSYNLFFAGKTAGAKISGFKYNPKE